MSFEEFCKVAGAEKPTQGLGYAYNYAAAASKALEDSWGDTPVQFKIDRGACKVTLSTDLLDLNCENFRSIIETLRPADHLEIRRDRDEFTITVTFRV